MTRVPPPVSSQLGALLRLVDDPSPRVRERVAAQLRSLGASMVEEAIRAANLALSPSQRAALDEALGADFPPRSEDATALLHADWHALGEEQDETRFLEAALWALSCWMQGEPALRPRGERRLDELAGEFRATGEPLDAHALARFLFGLGRLRGAAPARYYEASNSDLWWVLEHGEGLPISLACVFILVGERLGLALEGCNFPGHFLARDARTGRLFDPYNSGRELSAREANALRQAAPGEMNDGASAKEIVARVLRNLSVAFYGAGENEDAALMLALLRDLE